MCRATATAPPPPSTGRRARSTRPRCSCAGLTLTLTLTLTRTRTLTLTLTLTLTKVELRQAQADAALRTVQQADHVAAEPTGRRGPISAGPRAHGPSYAPPPLPAAHTLPRSASHASNGFRPSAHTTVRLCALACGGL